MTPTPDHSPAATERDKVPTADPVDKAPTVESETDPAPHQAGHTSNSHHDDAAPSEPLTAEDEDQGVTDTASSRTDGNETTIGFQDLSFAAISAAHEKSLGPRTISGEVDPPDEPNNGETSDHSEPLTPALSTALTRAETNPTEDAEEKVEAEEVEAEEVESDTAETDGVETQKTGAEPEQISSGTKKPAVEEGLFTPPAARDQEPSGPASIPSPPLTPHEKKAPFSKGHDYAPEAAYAGWAPSTAADEASKRRRYILIGGAILGAVAVIVTLTLMMEAINRHQWEPLDAMLVEPQQAHPLQLVLGSCVETIPPDGEITEVLAVPCDTAHTGQIVGRTDFADAAIWPGRDEADNRVAKVCGTQQLGPIARTSPLVDTLRYVVWSPSEKSWSDGDRIGLCLATTTEPITQDLLQ